MSHNTKFSVALFLLRWIGANIFGYGFALFAVGLSDNPFVLISWLCLSIGINQWFVLRQFTTNPYDWLFQSICTTIILTFYVWIFADIRQYWMVPYVFASALSQSWFLRKSLRQAWLWSAIALGAQTAGLLVGVVCYSMLRGDRPESVSTAQISFILIGAILTYSLISGIGFIALLKKSDRGGDKSRDRQQGIDRPPDSRMWVTQLLLSVISLAIFLPWAAFSYYALSESGEVDLAVLTPFFFLYSFAIAYAYHYVSILAHELGHLCFGMMAGFKFNFLAVSRVLCVRTHQGIRLRLFKRIAAGGITSTIPAKVMSQASLKKKLIVMILGGPIASFVLFLCGASLLFFPRVYVTFPPLSMVILLSGLSLGMAVINSLPVKFGHVQTDGSLILTLLKSTNYGRGYMAIYDYLAENESGIRPWEMSDAIAKTLDSAPEKSMLEFSGLTLSYYKEIDSENHDRAFEYLDKAYERKEFTPEFYRSEMLLESAYFHALFKNSPDVAQERFDEARDRSLIEQHTIARVEAALHLAKGEAERALHKARDGQHLIRSYKSQTGRSLAELDWLTDLEKRAELALQQAN